MKVEDILATANEKNVVANWDDAHRYAPAPRQRRRLILNMLEGLDFADCLDAGCAQPFLLQAIVERFGVAGFGCDISDQVMEGNRQVLPDAEFQVIDLTRETWSNSRKFDLVVCSEVLEHIPDWKAALAHLVEMSERHLLITVPSGSLRTMDKLVGHHRHFAGPELVAALEEHGCKIESVRFWGFPVQSLYKWAISKLSPEKLYSRFSCERYGLGKRFVSQLICLLFYLNDLGASGPQLLIHARAPSKL